VKYICVQISVSPKRVDDSVIFMFCSTGNFKWVWGTFRKGMETGTKRKVWERIVRGRQKEGISE
jgi:hypothetical protein